MKWCRPQVLPVCGKYELLGSPPPEPARSPRSSRTVTSLAWTPHPPCFEAPRPDLPRRENNPESICVLGSRAAEVQTEQDRQPLRACSSTYDTPL
ncbi:hypothetical protein PAL_GLEAN10008502 [Pteropus alecto]|uniref:Uncharacterized protein n=1 Tax=Pteropus alecto TaxID=9402 RepID=L5KKN0_PTEAL|nr:hypothetical protein PAL_GLEAN10008502 [Pteropus alecto]